MRFLIHIHFIDIGTELILVTLYRPIVLIWSHKWSGLICDLHIAVEGVTILMASLSIINSDDIGFLSRFSNSWGDLLGTAEERSYLVLLNLTTLIVKGLFWVRVFQICLLKWLFRLLS